VIFGKLTSRVALVAAGRLAVPAAALATNMILARVLAREALGRLQEVSVHLQIVLNIATVVIQTTLYNFLPRVAPAQRRSFLRRNAGAVIVAAAIVSGTVYLGAEPIAWWVGEAANTPLVRAAAVALFVSIVATLADPIFIVHERGDLSAATTVLGAAVQVGCVAALVRDDGRLIYFFWAIAVGQVLRLVWGGTFARCHLPRGEEEPAPSEIFAQELAFMGPVALTAALDTVSSNLDRVLVARLFDPAAMAAYTLGAVELPFIGVLMGAVTAVLLPNLAEKLARGEFGQVRETWARAVRKGAVILFGLFWLFLWIAEEFMTLLFSSRYTESATYFRVYLLLLPMRAIAFMPILYALGKATTVLVGAAGDLVLNLALSLVFIKVLGLDVAGAAWGTVAATILQSVFYLAAVRSAMKTSWDALLPWRALARDFLLAGVWMLPLAGVRLFTAPHWVRLGVAMLLGTCYAAFVVLPQLRHAGDAEDTNRCTM
jgi:O-antigen/teichoic acid export membrane protein